MLSSYSESVSPISIKRSLYGLEMSKIRLSLRVSRGYYCPSLSGETYYPIFLIAGLTCRSYDGTYPNSSPLSSLPHLITG
jgi:hypothetical protein